MIWDLNKRLILKVMTLRNIEIKVKENRNQFIRYLEPCLLTFLFTSWTAIMWTICGCIDVFKQQKFEFLYCQLLNFNWRNFSSVFICIIVVKNLQIFWSLSHRQCLFSQNLCKTMTVHVMCVYVFLLWNSFIHWSFSISLL